MIEFDSTLVTSMVMEAVGAYPFEVVGVVGCREDEAIELVTLKNVAPDPRVNFAVDPREQFELEERFNRDGLEIGAIFHSHIKSEPEPSELDVRFGKFWPDTLMIIIGPMKSADTKVRAWRISSEGDVKGVALNVGVETGTDRGGDRVRQVAGGGNV